MIYAEVSENGKITTYESTVSDGVTFETIKFKFPKTWDGFVKTATFVNQDKKVSIILNGDSNLCTGEDECYIPCEVLKSPEFAVSVFGVSGDSVAITSQAVISVKESGYDEGYKPSDPTPSEYEQLINLANETKEIARSVRNDADNGVFKGEKGDPGEPGAKGDKGDRGEKGETGATGPQGLKGDKGDKGDTGEQGIQGVKGDNGEDGYTPQKGVDYFTNEDIASLNIPTVDQTYNPESENAQSGKAVAEAISEKQYELIEEITLTEDTQTITRTQEPNNNAYKFKNILAIVEIQGTNEDGYILCDNRLNKKGLNPNGLTIDNFYTWATLSGIVGKTRIFVETKQENGLYRIYFNYPYTNSGSPDKSIRISNSSILAPDSYINKFILTKNPTFSVGTKISIYGVRA